MRLRSHDPKVEAIYTGTMHLTNAAPGAEYGPVNSPKTDNEKRPARFNEPLFANF